MSSFTYGILLVSLLCQRQTVAGGNINVAKSEEEKCSSEIVKQISETMDLVYEVHAKMNNTEVYLDQLRKELREIRNSRDAFQERLEKYLGKAATNRAALGARDCSDIRSMGFTTSGVYRIYAGDDRKKMQVDVYCDFNSFKESWLVFQRRMDGSENFERNYTDYERGFGNLSGEFWLANEALHLLTTSRKYKLRIDLEDFEGNKRYAEYTTFSVNSSKDSYRLTIGGYSGNAGDSMATHNRMKFTTRDIENDPWPRGNCAVLYHGAYWYNGCHQANLNGLYLRGPHKSFADGINWYHWHGLRYSLKKTEMKLVPLEE